MTESKSGRTAILAERVIDCTGDADVAALAGARFVKSAAKGNLGMTTVFSCAGVDKERFLAHVEAHPATYKNWSRVWAQVSD